MTEQNKMPKEIFAYKVTVDTGATVYGWERSRKTDTTSYTRTDLIPVHTELLKQARDALFWTRKELEKHAEIKDVEVFDVVVGEQRMIKHENSEMKQCWDIDKTIAAIDNALKGDTEKK